MRGTYIGRDRMLVDVAYGGMLIVPSEDFSLMPILTTTGVLEAPLTKFFLAQVKPGHTIVDIGANVGYFTVLAAKLVGAKGRVIGYEANPHTFRVLQDNLALNWLTDQEIILRNEAAYSENTHITFHASAKFVGDSSIYERPASDNYVDEVTSIQVPGVRLDDALRRVEKINLLKIDIEGGEFHAFTGMMDMIRSRKIERIAFEWNKIMLGADAPKFASILREIQDSCGGVLHVLNDEGFPSPVSLEALEQVPWYPFAVIEF